MPVGLDGVVCPYCRHIDENWHEYVSPEDMEADFPLDCENPECGKEFHVRMKTQVWFTTSKEPLDEDTQED